MPLSDHEQKILAELEESLSKQDPRFAKNVRDTNVYSHSLRQIRWSVIGFVVGLIIIVTCFASNLYLGIAGVAVMFASAVIAERNVRRMGKASWRDIMRPGSGDDASRVDGKMKSLRDWVGKLRQRPR